MSHAHEQIVLRSPVPRAGRSRGTFRNALSHLRRNRNPGNRPSSRGGLFRHWRISGILRGKGSSKPANTGNHDGHGIRVRLQFRFRTDAGPRGGRTGRGHIFFKQQHQRGGVSGSVGRGGKHRQPGRRQHARKAARNARTYLFQVQSGASTNRQRDNRRSGGIEIRATSSFDFPIRTSFS